MFAAFPSGVVAMSPRDFRTFLKARGSQRAPFVMIVLRVDQILPGYLLSVALGLTVALHCRRRFIHQSFLLFRFTLFRMARIRRSSVRSAKVLERACFKVASFRFPIHSSSSISFPSYHPFFPVFFLGRESTAFAMAICRHSWRDSRGWEERSSLYKLEISSPASLMSPVERPEPYLERKS